MEDNYNFSTHYIRIRKLSGKLWIEVWELYEPILRLQVPLTYYTYSIIGEDFNIVRK